MLRPFYFTFGADAPEQPFKGGWVVLYAKTRQQADKLFKRIFSSKEYPNCRYSMMYDDEQFVKTSMYSKGTNHAKGCHMVIVPGEEMLKC